MSESHAVKVAILDKFRQILVVLYQRRAKKMSENAERPARSGRGSGKKAPGAGAQSDDIPEPANPIDPVNLDLRPKWHWNLRAKRSILSGARDH